MAGRTKGAEVRVMPKLDARQERWLVIGSIAMGFAVMLLGLWLLTR